jgi:hypothetical protein
MGEKLTAHLPGLMGAWATWCVRLGKPGGGIEATVMAVGRFQVIDIAA